MDAAPFLALALSCAPQVDTRTTHALATVESGLNPHAIGVVGGALARQPRHRSEALATARSLQAQGWDFSVGLTQINVRNVRRMGLRLEEAFDPCINLQAMQTLLGDCYERSPATSGQGPARDQHRLRQALSCYYSGNFVTGFRHGYVQRVLDAARRIPAAPHTSPIPSPPTP
jgi:type IV secretion system protein VirB1